MLILSGHNSSNIYDVSKEQCGIHTASGGLFSLYKYRNRNSNINRNRNSYKKHVQ